MSSKNLRDKPNGIAESKGLASQPQRENKSNKSKDDSKLKSSIVHKPFATGTINIFNPYKNRDKDQSKLSPPKLFLNAELEQDLDKRKAELELSELNLEPEEIEYQDTTWLDSLLSPWGISAIAILCSINLISAGFIWRNARNSLPEVQENAPITKIGDNHFGDREFIPLNLGTLGAIESTIDEAVESEEPIPPIPPALAPLNNISRLSSFNTEYHYILSSYAGEESLFLAQQQVEQVSLVNFPQGLFVYMGAFKNRDDADLFVNHLKQENFPAHVYPLD